MAMDDERRLIQAWGKTIEVVIAEDIANRNGSVHLSKQRVVAAQSYITEFIVGRQVKLCKEWRPLKLLLKGAQVEVGKKKDKETNDPFEKNGDNKKAKKEAVPFDVIAQMLINVDAVWTDNNATDQERETAAVVGLGALLQLYGQLRVSEVRRLRWRDLDDRDGIWWKINISRSKTDPHSHGTTMRMAPVVVEHADVALHGRFAGKREEKQLRVLASGIVGRSIVMHTVDNRNEHTQYVFPLENNLASWGIEQNNEPIQMLQYTAEGASHFMCVRRKETALQRPLVRQSSSPSTNHDGKDEFEQVNRRRAPYRSAHYSGTYHQEQRGDKGTHNQFDILSTDEEVELSSEDDEQDNTIRRQRHKTRHKEKRTRALHEDDFDYDALPSIPSSPRRDDELDEATVPSPPCDSAQLTPRGDAHTPVGRKQQQDQEEQRLREQEQRVRALWSSSGMTQPTPSSTYPRETDALSRKSRSEEMTTIDDDNDEREVETEESDDDDLVLRRRAAEKKKNGKNGKNVEMSSQPPPPQHATTRRRAIRARTKKTRQLRSEEQELRDGDLSVSHPVPVPTSTRHEDVRTRQQQQEDLGEQGNNDIDLVEDDEHNSNQVTQTDVDTHVELRHCTSAEKQNRDVDGSSPLSASNRATTRRRNTRARMTSPHQRRGAQRKTNHDHDVVDGVAARAAAPSNRKQRRADEQHRDVRTRQQQQQAHEQMQHQVQHYLEQHSPSSITTEIHDIHSAADDRPG